LSPRSWGGNFYPKTAGLIPPYLFPLADSDLSRDIDSRRSKTGFLFFLGSYLISWQSKQQASVALSSMEAENMSACACSQEEIWLKRLLEEFGCRFSGPLTVFEDNMACIYYLKKRFNLYITKYKVM